MKADAVSFDEELDELEDFDDDEGEEERGLSGLVVLLMGVVMLGALASVVWIAYKQGVRNGQAQGGTPYVQADPEPLKIENDVAATDGGDLAVYDRVGGQQSDPVEVIAEGTEEPVARGAEDPIGAIAAKTQTPVADDAVADRITKLAEAAEAKFADAAPASSAPPAEVKAAPKPATAPTAVSTAQAAPTPAKPTVTYRSGGALTGSHLVQIGAFRSEAEADSQWTRLQGKLGDYLDGKAQDVERADLGDKGTFYRLRIGPFTSADDAKTYCSGLKERGTDCLIKAK